MPQQIVRQSDQGAIWRESVDIFKRDLARKKHKKHKDDPAGGKDKEKPKEDPGFWPLVARHGSTMLTPELLTVMQNLHNHVLDVGGTIMDATDTLDKMRDVHELHKHDLKKHLQHQFAHQWYGNANDFIADYSKANGILPKPKDMVDHAKGWLTKNKPGPKTAALMFAAILPSLRLAASTSRYLFLPHWDPMECVSLMREHTADMAHHTATINVNDELMNQAKGGGFTLHDHVGDAPTNGYMVSLHKNTEKSLPMNQLNPGMVSKYVGEHTRDLAHPDSYLGGWLDGKNFYLDVSSHRPSLDRATHDAIRSNQLGIYDLAHGQTLYTPNALDQTGDIGLAYPDRIKDPLTARKAAVPPIQLDPITTKIMYMALPEHDWTRHDLGDQEHWANEPSLHVAELETGWNTTGPSDGTLQDTGAELGTHHAHVMKHPHTGESWLVKPAPSSGPFLPDLDVGANQIAAASGVETPATFMTKYKGKPASAQRMYPGAKDAFPGGFDPESVSDTDMLEVQKHHALDWMLGNHDSHHGQFVRDQDGKLIGIDKGQAGKYAGYDRLHWNFHPNAAYGEKEPVYNTLYRNFAKGGRKPFDPRQGELSHYIQGLQDMDDNDVTAALEPYAKKAADVGQLANLGGGNPGQFPGLLQQPTVIPNDPSSYLKSVLERKNSLMAQMGDLHDRAMAHRMTGTKIAKTAAPNPQELTPSDQHGQMGSHGATVYADKTGHWLIKMPAPGNEFMVPLDVATSRLLSAMDLEAPETYAIPMNGRIATAVRWMQDTHQAWETPPQLASVTPQDLLTLQKHHAVDWLIANHDPHVGNWLRTKEGNLVGIDKGQAMKYFGMDRLSYDFYPNYYAREPIYNALFREYAWGKTGQLLDPREGELGEFVARLAAFDDDEFRAMFAPYAHAAAKVGLLATGSVKADPVDPRRRLGAAKVARNDPEGFLDALIARKHALAADLGDYYDRAQAQRLSVLANPMPPFDFHSFQADCQEKLGGNMWGSSDPDYISRSLREYIRHGYPTHSQTIVMAELHAKYFEPSQVAEVVA